MTHGGSGSRLGALGAGLPELMVPQGEDQFYNAERVLAARVRLVLGRGELSAEAAAAAVGRLLAEPEFLSRARAVRDEVADMPSPREAVHELETLVAVQKADVYRRTVWKQSAQ